MLGLLGLFVIAALRVANAFGDTQFQGSIADAGLANAWRLLRIVDCALGLCFDLRRARAQVHAQDREVGHDIAWRSTLDTRRIDREPVALELIDSGGWEGAGVLGPEALPADPFLGLLTDYGSGWACEERIPRVQ